jgi:hypothetical protein
MVTNTLAYYKVLLTCAVKKFIAQVLGRLPHFTPYISKHWVAVVAEAIEHSNSRLNRYKRVRIINIDLNIYMD